MFCPYCGTSISNANGFCPECGARLGEAAGVPEEFLTGGGSRSAQGALDVVAVDASASKAYEGDAAATGSSLGDGAGVIGLESSETASGAPLTGGLEVAGHESGAASSDKTVMPEAASAESWSGGVSSYESFQNSQVGSVNSSGEMPTAGKYLALAIIAFLCNYICGAIAIFQYRQMKKAIEIGDVQTAQSKAKNVKIAGFIGIGIFVLASLVSIAAISSS
ncbi:MAG: zinc ribbon domain-containing protein [Atopobiaceae bacterium]|nr:zinc ribbon domain-containing protein [Atopobiaceae bacterium]